MYLKNVNTQHGREEVMERIIRFGRLQKIIKEINEGNFTVNFSVTRNTTATTYEEPEDLESIGIDPQSIIDLLEEHTQHQVKNYFEETVNYLEGC